MAKEGFCPAGEMNIAELRREIYGKMAQIAKNLFMNGIIWQVISYYSLSSDFFHNRENGHSAHNKNNQVIDNNRIY